MILYLNKRLYIVYIFKYICGLNLYKFNLLLCLNNISIFNIKNNIVNIKMSIYRLNMYIPKNLKIKINNIIINKIKKFNIK
uniref:Open reading frame 91 n=1 Tax=Plasmodium coatneyi TaxID=208452 RepID=H7CDL3_9APIC|nr:open reading frame 91 [Plasmodium coatneyi]